MESNFLTSIFGDRYLYEVSRDLFSEVSARQLYERELPEDQFKEDSLYIFVGADSGNLIKYISSIKIPVGTRILFLEPSWLVDKIRSECERDLEDERILLSGAEDIESIREEILLDVYIQIDAISIIRSISASHAFLPEYGSVFWEAQSYIENLKWKSLGSMAYEVFIRRQLENCADNRCSASLLKNALRGASVLVLGGGPSLDEHLDWIIKNRNSFYIFAVARIASRLIELDLEPDFVFSVDPSDKSYQMSREILRFSENVIFINQFHVASGLIKNWTHRKFFTGNLLPWDSGLNPSPGDYFGGAGPTVTNHAVATAGWLGAKHIYLCGVDFCFTEEGYTHALGSCERLAGPSTETTGLYRVTNAGHLAPTRPDFLEASASMNAMARAMKLQGVSVENLSLNSMKLASVPYTSAKEIVLEQRPPMNFQEVAEDEYRDLQLLKNELEEKLAIQKEFLILVDKATKIHSDMYIDDLVDPHKKAALERVDQEMTDIYRDFMEIVKRISLRSLVRMSHKLSNINELDSCAVRNRLEIYYQSIEFGLKRLINYTETAIQTTQRRLDEYNVVKGEMGGVSKLLTSWLKNGESGRYRKFDFIIDKSPHYSELVNAFESELSRDYIRIQAGEQKLSNFLGLSTRLRMLYDTKDRDGLLVLRKALSLDPDYDDSLPVIDSLIFDLEGDVENAISCVADTTKLIHTPILEFALVHIFRLSSKSGYQQSALDALATLSLVNKKYLRVYASALASNGQINDAIEHILVYVEYFGADEIDKKKIIEWYDLIGIDAKDLPEIFAQED